MPKIRQKSRRRSPLVRIALVISSGLLIDFLWQNNNKNTIINDGRSSSPFKSIIMVNGLLITTPSRERNRNHHSYRYSQSSSQPGTITMPSSNHPTMQRRRRTRNRNRNDVMILNGVVPGNPIATDRDRDNNNNNNTKNQSKSKSTTETTITTTDDNERKMLETLWSYVNNLQRARKIKGDKKAANALAYYLHNNKVDEKISPILVKVVKFDEDDDVHDNDDDDDNIVAENSNTNTNTNSSAIQLLSSLQEVLERALIPALRQAGESNDYKMILRLVSGSVAFANNYPILTPRIFGEAINALSQTKSNAAKLKSVWNIMIGNTTTIETETGNNNNRLPLFLSGPPTAFELNIFLKSMASRGKSKACIDLYRQHIIREGSSISSSLSSSTSSWLSVPSSSSYSNIYIHPDAYTISILLSILADSISIDQMMCDPIDFSATIIENTTSATIPIRKTTTDSTKSMWSKVKSLSYSTCWQWNAAMDLFSTLPDDNNRNKNGKYGKNNEIIRWRNNYVYSSLLKLQDKSEDLCNRRSNDNDFGHHKNGPELTMIILDDMINNDVIPDTVTCSQAIKAMGRAAVGSTTNIMRSTTTTTTNDNLAVDFLEQMKSNSKLPNPNQYTYSAVIKTCAQMKNHRTALRLLEEMRNDYYTTTNNNNNNIRQAEDDDDVDILGPPPPNTWVYNAALLSLDNKENKYLQPTTTRRGRNKNTKKLWSQRNKEMNQQQRTDIALNLLDQMKDDHEHFDLDTKPDTVTYNTVLGVGTFPHHHTTNLTESTTTTILSLIDQMKNEGVDRDAITYSNCIDASTNGDELMTILRQCLQDSAMINQNALTSVFNSGLFTSTFWQDFGMFKDILKLMFERGIPMDGETLTAMIYAIGKNEKGVSLESLIELIEGRDDHDSSMELTTQQELLKSIGLIDDFNVINKIPVLVDSHYAEAIEICLKENEFAHAYNILSKMRAKGLHPTTICMEGFALAYAQSAIDAAAKLKGQNESTGENLSRVRAYSAYKIAQALVRPRPSTLGRVARACATTGQWKLCRGLLRSIHNDVLSSNEDGSFIADNLRVIETVRGTHSFILRECAKQGSLSSGLWYTNDIQEFSRKIRTKHQLDQNEIVMSHISEVPSDEDDIFGNLRIFTDAHPSKTSIGMQPQDWISLIQAASKADRWQVCVNTLQFLRPYVERTNLSNSDNNSNDSNEDRYNRLTPALTAVTRSLESHSQYAWSVRVIEDWTEWSGRKPRLEAVLSAIRVLSSKGCIEEIRKLIATCLQKDLTSSVTKYGLVYEEMIYVGAVTSLHNNGLYDDADEMFMSGVQDGFLPFEFVRENGQFVLDLHGLNVALTHSAVRIAMRQQAVTLAKETTQSNMIIITGMGRNSEFHLRPVLRPEVQRMLLEEFYPPLNTMSVPGNMGALLVLADDISRWQEHQEGQKGVRMLELAGILRSLSPAERLKKTIALSLKSNNNND